MIRTVSRSVLTRVLIGAVPPFFGGVQVERGRPCPLLIIVDAVGSRATVEGHNGVLVGSNDGSFHCVLCCVIG